MQSSALRSPSLRDHRGAPLPRPSAPSVAEFTAEPGPHGVAEPVADAGQHEPGVVGMVLL